MPEMNNCVERSILASTLQPLLQAQSDVGALAFIIHPNGSTEALAFGSLAGRAESLERVAPNLYFPIFSITKTLIATIALAMRDAGSLDLEIPISTYSARTLPAWLGGKTMKSLLMHRAGLTDYGQMPRYHEDVRRSPNHAESFETYFNSALAGGAPPDDSDAFLYSNIGYRLVREILERVSYQPLSQLVKKYIGDKLRIELTPLESTSNSIVEGHSPYLEKSAPDVRDLYDFNWVYHGVFRSSVADIAKIFANLNQLISPKSLEEMTALRSLNIEHPALNPSYGIGLMGDLNFKNGGIYGHSGGGPGFSTACYHQPSTNRTIAAMINRDSVLPAETLAWAYLSSPVTT